MTKVHYVLAGILAVQILLGVITWWPSSDATGEPRKVIDVEKDAVTGLTVEREGDDETEGSSVELVREGDAWRLASAAGYPATDKLVDEVLDHLVGMQVRDPVATQAANHAAFNVADDDFGRKVRVEAGERSWSFYLGSATGKAVYLREVDSDDVYLVRGFNEWAIKDLDSAYWNAVYLEVPEEEVLSLEIIGEEGSIGLVHEDVWQVDAEPPEGRSFDPGKVQALARKALKLRIKDAVGTVPEAAYGLDGGVRVQWTVDVGGDTETTGYVLGAEDGAEVYAKADDKPFVVKVSKYGLDDLRSASISSLLVDME